MGTASLDVGAFEHCCGMAERKESVNISAGNRSCPLEAISFSLSTSPNIEVMLEMASRLPVHCARQW